MSIEICRRTLCGNEFESEFTELPCYVDRMRLILVLDTHEDLAIGRDFVIRRRLSFGICQTEFVIDTHHLSSRFHLGTQDRIDSGEAIEWKYCFFDSNVLDAFL